MTQGGSPPDPIDQLIETWRFVASKFRAEGSVESCTRAYDINACADELQEALRLRVGAPSVGAPPAPELQGLIEAVNACRYRGVDGKAPMKAAYGWPGSFDMMDRITVKALAYVLSLEAASLAAERPQEP